MSPVALLWRWDSQGCPHWLPPWEPSQNQANSSEDPSYLQPAHTARDAASSIWPNFLSPLSASPHKEYHSSLRSCAIFWWASWGRWQWENIGTCRELFFIWKIRCIMKLCNIWLWWKDTPLKSTHEPQQMSWNMIGIYVYYLKSHSLPKWSVTFLNKLSDNVWPSWMIILILWANNKSSPSSTIKNCSLLKANNQSSDSLESNITQLDPRSEAKHKKEKNRPHYPHSRRPHSQTSISLHRSPPKGPWVNGSATSLHWRSSRNWNWFCRR